MENKIKRELKAYLLRNEADLKSIDGFLIESFTQENDSWLNFNLIERSTESDGWYEAITDMRRDNRYFTVVFNHDVAISYDDNNFNEVVLELIRIYEDCEKVLKILS